MKYIEVNVKFCRKTEIVFFCKTYYNHFCFIYNLENNILLYSCIQKSESARLIYNLIHHSIY